MTVSESSAGIHGRSPHEGRLPFALWCLPWLFGAALLCFWAWPAQWQRGCWMGEWPFEQGCSAYPQGAKEGNTSSVYLEHLQRNVGDSRAWTWLVGTLAQEEDPRVQALLPRALELAPNHPTVLALQATAQLESSDWGAAVKTLITLLERNQPQARPALLGLMMSEDTQPLVLEQLSAEAHWLDTLLASLEAKMPASALLPFISAGQELGLLKPATIRTLVGRLKAEGAWVDAYVLWVASKGEVGAGLYNSGFDRPFSQNGFDWEWASQTGPRQAFRVAQVPASPNPGSMLELTLTGRGVLPTPIVSQALILPGPRYRLRGKYMTDRLLSKEGLVWALRCAAGGERWAHTAPMRETQRKWASFELEFEVPLQCAAAVRLQLETSAAWESRSGVAGTVVFDDFSIDGAAAAEPSDEPQPKRNARGGHRD